MKFHPQTPCVLQKGNIFQGMVKNSQCSVDPCRAVNTGAHNKPLHFFACTHNRFQLSSQSWICFVLEIFSWLQSFPKNEMGGMPVHGLLHFCQCAVHWFAMKTAQWTFRSSFKDGTLWLGQRFFGKDYQLSMQITTLLLLILSPQSDWFEKLVGGQKLCCKAKFISTACTGENHTGTTQNTQGFLNGESKQFSVIPGGIKIINSLFISVPSVVSSWFNARR